MQYAPIVTVPMRLLLFSTTQNHLRHQVRIIDQEQGWAGVSMLGQNRRISVRVAETEDSPTFFGQVQRNLIGAYWTCQRLLLRPAERSTHAQLIEQRFDLWNARASRSVRWAERSSHDGRPHVSVLIEGDR